MSPESAVGHAWTAWIVSWVAAAFWADRAAKRLTWGDEALSRGVVVAGAAMLFALGGGVSHGALWMLSAAAGWTLAAATALGFLFCWWARIHLGRLWSARVTKKADHRVVDTGPYRIVRHPIYTGVLTAAFATAVIKGTSLALAGAGVMAAGFWIKARLEERFLQSELGSDAYASYRRRTPMLLPFGPK